MLTAAAATTAYTYVGYPLLIGLVARLHRPSVPADPGGQPELLPTMTVLIPALDEEAIIGAKVNDVLAQEYPHELDVVVIADGSTDATAAIARDLGVRVLFEPARHGKAAAVNRGLEVASGDIVCLSDANCALEPGALLALGREFLDGRTAVVSGAKTVWGTGALGGGESLYWKIESHLKRSESVMGCTMGAVGELCGLRRNVTRPIPPGVINDDYHLSCDAMVRGFAVRYAPTAHTSERVSMTPAEELERRTRIAAGTWQTTIAHLALSDPRRRWVSVAFLSHRVLRSLVVPFLLPLMAVAAVTGARRSRFARFMVVSQAAAYGAAAYGAATDANHFSAPFQFAMTNVATVRGAFRYATGRQPVAWQKVDRREWS